MTQESLEHDKEEAHDDKETERRIRGRKQKQEEEKMEAKD